MQAPTLPLKTLLGRRSCARKQVRYCPSLSITAFILKAQMLMPYPKLLFNSSLVMLKRFAASLLPPPVWFYAFDPRGTSRFTFLAFRPQSLLGYLLSPPALSTVISQRERTAAARPGEEHETRLTRKKLMEIVELL